MASDTSSDIPNQPFYQHLNLEHQNLKKDFSLEMRSISSTNEKKTCMDCEALIGFQVVKS